MLADAAKQDIAEREVTILGDRNTPYSVLRKVMATCTDAEYGKVSLAVIERETGGAGRATARTASLIELRARVTIMALAPYYRLYDLPWSPTEEVERRFRKVLRNAFIVFAIFAILIPLLPVPEQAQVEGAGHSGSHRQAGDREEGRRRRRRRRRRSRRRSPSRSRRSSSRSRRRRSRMRARRRRTPACSSCRISSPTCATTRCSTRRRMTKNLTGKVGETTRSERSLITSKVGTSSGGINTASLSRGYGGGAGSLTGHTTTQVIVRDARGAGGPTRCERGAGSGKASRSEEEIALVFDRNKGAIYALYTRALRDKPDLQGKLVLELTIGADGSVTRCEVVSSELNDPELERKLVARVKLFRFEAKDVGTITVTKPIDFFPA